MIPLWYTILLAVMFPSFLSVLLMCMYYKDLYPGFSVFRDTISEIQDTSTRTSKYINPTFALMGICLMPLPYYFSLILEPGWLTTIGIFVLYCNPLGLLVLAIWPDFTNNMHYVGAGLGMGGTLLAMILLGYPIFISTNATNLLLIPIVIGLLICIPLVYSNVVYGPRSKIMHNPNIWEWLEFYTLQAWTIAIAVNLIVI